MAFRGMFAVLLLAVSAMLLGACNGTDGGSLVVYLQPADAVDDGARWRVDGGVWQPDGATADGLDEGAHTVEFQAVDGWYAPDAASVSITAGETTSLTQSYLEGHADWEEDTVTYNVTLHGDTVYVDESNLDLLLAESKADFEYEFDAQEAAVRGISFDDGAPLLIHGVAARRITTTTLEGGVLVVETEFAPLNEVIRDGTVAWDYGVEFTPEKVRMVTVAGKEPRTTRWTLVDDR